jgi:hydrogenase/urease accessory protein HupE
MSEWWTYRPADLLMFSPETYYRLFELYNADVWPAQIIVLSAGFTMFVLMFRGPRWRGHAVAALLAAAWLVVAWAYFLERYTTINLAAPYFAWGFSAQAVLTAVSGVLMGRLVFDNPRSLVANVGIALLLFAVLLADAQHVRFQGQRGHP